MYITDVEKAQLTSDVGVRGVEESHAGLVSTSLHTVAFAIMAITLRRTDSDEQVERKILRAARAKKKAKDPVFDPYRFLGKLKGVFGDGLDCQKRVRDEW